MSSLFSKPKGVDKDLVAAQKKQLAEAEARQDELDAQEDARKRAASARSKGRAALLSGSETGVDTLGG